jgi:outer membrane putative beta-barrel porin/alpha-amylase
MTKVKTPALATVILLLLLQSTGLKAQTDEDAIMMSKNNFCVGGTYSHSSWDHYWEGTFHRNNLNLGTVSTQMVSLMGNYGITRKLNVMVGAPYVWTHATAGTLHGEHGIQDLSAWLKWLAVEQNIGKGVLSIYALGGASIPLTNYISDYLPLAIGLHSKTLSGRLMADYQQGNFFVTALGTYTWRHDIDIDQNAYYTTSLHLTNQVYMPNVASEMLRIGYRSDRWIIEALATNMNTLGGFDIRKNDMPFPSNKMNSTMIGGHVKYSFKKVDGLSLNVDYDYTVAGRNVGQATNIAAGVFYILDFSKKSPKNTSNKPKS